MHTNPKLCTKFRSLPLFLAATAFVALVFAIQASAQHIEIFDVPGAGTSAGQGSNPWGISAQGTIVGWYVVGDYALHGFLRTHQGDFTTFDASGAGVDASQGIFPVAINAKGEIVGAYLDAGFVFHGFLRTPKGEFIQTDDLLAGTNPGTGTRVVDINSAGSITGWSDDSFNTNHIFIRDARRGTTEFYAPGAGKGDGQGTFMPTFYGINPAGAITGWYVDSNNVMHGYLRAPDGTFTPFDAPGAGTDSSVCAGAPAAPGAPPWLVGTQAGSLNPEGAVVGQYVDTNCVIHGFLRGADGSITQFDAPGAGTGAGQGTSSVSNNPAGEVTGYYLDRSNVYHGFVRAKDGEFTTFDVLGAGTHAFQGTLPFGNTPAGVIGGYYVDANGAQHGFVRMPH